MPLFTITWMDKPGAFDLRAATREAHLAYAAAQGDRVRLGGPFLDAEGRMIGSLMIIEAESLGAAQAFHDADPYKLAGLFERSEVRPWKATAGAAAGAVSTGS